MRSTKVIIVALVMMLGAELSAAQEAEIGSQRGRISPLVAAGLSLVSTAVPIAAGFALAGPEGSGGQVLALVGVGVTIGPGVGHAYAHNTPRLTRGALIRLAAGAIAVAGARNIDPWGGTHDGNAWIVFVTGGTVCAASAVYDIASAHSSANSYNRSLSAASISFQPVYFGEEHALGLSVSLRL